MSKTKFIIEPGKQEVTITRTFSAPCELVFKAFTDHKLIPLWWGPRDHNTTVDEMEVKRGGKWRYVSRTLDGNIYAFHGVYHEVVAPGRIVNTFEFEGVPGHVVLDTLTLAEQNGKTNLTIKSVFQSVDDRDEMVKSGMEEGASQSYDRLEEYLTSLTH